LRQVQEDQAALEQSRVQAQTNAERAALDLRALRERMEAMRGALAKLEQSPVHGKTLRYQTPVSETVQTEEFHFECRNGRVTFVDVGAMLGEIKQNLRANAETLRRQWEVRGRTRPSGAFLLEYTIEREKGIIDAVASPGRPDNDASFRYSLS